MKCLDLFSGIGGISLALEYYVETVGYVEIDKYAQSVLLSRMVEGSIKTAPIFRDITRLDGTKLRGHVDAIIGGFPCQDISVAGNGKGLDGKRSGLFFEIVRLIKEVLPVFIFLENVPAIRTRGLDVVLKELTALGYDCRWTVISASSVGACHKRDRWFLLAHANSVRGGIQQITRQEQQTKTNINYNGEAQLMADSNSVRKLSKQREYEGISNGSQGVVSDSLCERLERQWEKSIGAESKLENTFHDSWWSVEPDVGRVANGVPNRVDRIKSLGNSVVPLQVKTAFEKLLGRLTQPKAGE